MTSAARQRLGNLGFVPLAWGTTLANLGDGVRFAAVPLLAITVTDDPTAIAGLTTAQLLPYLLFALLAGVAADRIGKRALLVISVVTRVLVLLVLVAAVLGDVLQLVWLYLAVFVLGLAEVLFDITAQAFVPELVDTRKLTKANSWLATGEIVAGRFLGPPLGGALIAIGLVVPFAGVAGALVLVLGLVLLLPRGSPPVGTTGRKPVFREIVDGLAWLVRHRLLRTLAALSVAMNFVISAWYSVLVLYSVDELGTGGTGFGVLLAVGGLGGVLGSATTPALRRRIGAGRLLPACVVLTGISQALLGLTSEVVAAGVLLALYTAIDTVWSVVCTSLRQELVPPELLGRVNAAYRTLGRGAAPLGALAGGVFVSVGGVQTPFLAGAPVLILAGLAATAVVNPRSVRAAHRDVRSPVVVRQGGHR